MKIELLSEKSDFVMIEAFVIPWIKRFFVESKSSCKIKSKIESIKKHKRSHILSRPQIVRRKCYFEALCDTQLEKLNLKNRFFPTLNLGWKFGCSPTWKEPSSSRHRHHSPSTFTLTLITIHPLSIVFSDTQLQVNDYWSSIIISL